MHDSLYPVSRCRMTTIFLLIVLVTQLANNYVNCRLPDVVKIGGIFEKDDLLELAFRQAVDQVNADRNLLPRTKLMPLTERVKPNDSFHAAKLVCNLIKENVWSLFSAQSSSFGWLLRSIAANLQIPHFSQFWDYRSSFNNNLYDSPSNNFSVNLYPEATSLSQAFMDLVLSRQWKSFTIIIEENEGLIQLKDLLKISSLSDKVKMTIMKHKGDVMHFKKLLKDIKKTESNIVLSVDKEKVPIILKQAVDMQMMTDYHNYLIASLDIHTVNLSQFQSYQTNITGLTLLDPKGLEAGILSLGAQDWGKSQQFDLNKYLPTSTALMYDAVHLFAKALDNFDRTNFVNFAAPVNCESKSPWSYGPALTNLIKTEQLNGLSGEVKIDQYGRRSDFSLHIIELKKNGFITAGTWTKSGISSSRNYSVVYDDVLEAMRDKIFIVSVPKKSSLPYVTLREERNYGLTNQNSQFIGYCVDLLELIAEVFETNPIFNTSFKYQIRFSIDGEYGSKNPSTGEWNGVIGELIRKEADLGIADLTATYERETAADFTMPFMNLGIAILFKKPGAPEPELFTFLKPFSTEVWLYLASAYLGMSLLLSLISRLTPYQWVSGHPCDPNPQELENEFTIGNSLWFITGSLMQQGSDLAPRAFSTRILASVWWFFTLIMVSSYTANLAASLTAMRMASPIESVEDLAKQTAIQYGCLEGGSTRAFFQKSNHSTFQRMWNTMSTTPGVLVKKNTDGIDRVNKGGYAYLMESTSIEYITKRNCNLTQVGQWLDNKGYGIATPPDSPYRTPISKAIVVLQDKGKLAELKNKWWLPEKSCPQESKSTTAASLGIDNIGGVFVVLGIGVAVACVFAVIEFIWKQLKIARNKRESIAKLMYAELLRIVKCGSSKRPINPATAKKSSIDSDSVEELDLANKMVKTSMPNFEQTLF